MKAWIVAAIALAIAPSAQAVCREPSAPRGPDAYDVPRKPACMTNNAFNAVPCTNFETQSYNDDVRAYERKIVNYLEDLRDYYDAGARYGECLRKELSGRRY